MQSLDSQLPKFFLNYQPSRAKTKLCSPQYGICEVAAMGFPSPASDYIERRLDLNDILMPHCNNTVLIETPNGCVLADKSLRLVPGA